MDSVISTYNSAHLSNQKLLGASSPKSKKEQRRAKKQQKVQKVIIDLISHKSPPNLLTGSTITISELNSRRNNVPSVFTKESAAASAPLRLAETFINPNDESSESVNNSRRGSTSSTFKKETVTRQYNPKHRTTVESEVESEVEDKIEESPPFESGAPSTPSLLEYVKDSSSKFVRASKRVMVAVVRFPGYMFSKVSNGIATFCSYIKNSIITARKS